MAGIYLHIPFCKKACHYCDFHFTTSLKYKDELLHAMMRELDLQKKYLGPTSIETIYFGGGTPSLIGAGEIQRLIDKIHQIYTVSSDPEITLEANPDDLDTASVQALKYTTINRLSIGIQSFFEEDLLWMNRAHNATEADSSVKRVQDAGFENITLDLIYGYPLLSDDKWRSNMQKVIAMKIPHVSAYAMTVEAKTALASFINKGKQPAMNESQSARNYLSLIETLSNAGFEHYETSNFAKPGCYSKHNTNYWKGVSYLGVGPSAHSFNGATRQWNVANNAKYIDGILKGNIPAEQEILTITNRVNEYIMTSLRTQWGMDLIKIENEFGPDYKKQIEAPLKQFIEKKHIILKNNTVILTTEGKLFADRISSELFLSE
ncbi:radical SAM family heme chaperone HemW [Pedobacter sp. P351]|uniref:radical SAM family heme chaperone HemW n=1 Tax=Pedobacter superstes TaxID=3133441 RepID=UPI0030B0C130